MRYYVYAGEEFPPGTMLSYDPGMDLKLFFSKVQEYSKEGYWNIQDFAKDVISGKTEDEIFEREPIRWDRSADEDVESHWFYIDKEDDGTFVVQYNYSISYADGDTLDESDRMWISPVRPANHKGKIVEVEI